MAENFCMESILFDAMEVSLPFNTILSRASLYEGHGSQVDV
jgi:hypothetical protein